VLPFRFSGVNADLASPADGLSEEIQSVTGTLLPAVDWNTTRVETESWALFPSAR